MEARGRERGKSIGEREVREREQGREGEKGKEQRVEGREKVGVAIRRGRGGIFKGNCDQQRESVHQKANEWKSNGLGWMGAMVFAWGLQRTLFLFCVPGKPLKLLEREATAQD